MKIEEESKILDHSGKIQDDPRIYSHDIIISELRYSKAIQIFSQQNKKGHSITFNECYKKATKALLEDSELYKPELFGKAILRDSRCTNHKTNYKYNLDTLDIDKLIEYDLLNIEYGLLEHSFVDNFSRLKQKLYDYAKHLIMQSEELCDEINSTYIKQNIFCVKDDKSKTEITTNFFGENIPKSLLNHFKCNKPPLSCVNNNASLNDNDKFLVERGLLGVYRDLRHCIAHNDEDSFRERKTNGQKQFALPKFMCIKQLNDKNMAEYKFAFRFDKCIVILDKSEILKIMDDCVNAYSNIPDHNDAFYKGLTVANEDDNILPSEKLQSAIKSIKNPQKPLNATNTIRLLHYDMMYQVFSEDASNPSEILQILKDFTKSIKSNKMQSKIVANLEKIISFTEQRDVGYDDLLRTALMHCRVKQENIKDSTSSEDGFTIYCINKASTEKFSQKERPQNPFFSYLNIELLATQKIKTQEEQKTINKKDWSHNGNARYTTLDYDILQLQRCGLQFIPLEYTSTNKSLPQAKLPA